MNDLFIKEGWSNLLIFRITYHKWCDAWIFAAERTPYQLTGLILGTESQEGKNLLKDVAFGPGDSDRDIW